MYFPFLATYSYIFHTFKHSSKSQANKGKIVYLKLLRNKESDISRRSSPSLNCIISEKKQIRSLRVPMCYFSLPH